MYTFKYFSIVLNEQLKIFLDFIIPIVILCTFHNEVLACFVPFTQGMIVRASALLELLLISF